MRSLTFALTALLLLSLAVPSARSDELRNVKVGQLVPPFNLKTLDGKTIDSGDLKGKTVILVFISAKQRSSEQAAVAAHTVFQELIAENITLVFATADAAQLDYFRENRDRTNVREPLMLDFNRILYGGLGLIVLPTTIVYDGSGTLRHVISSYKSDYAHVLKSYARHVLGIIDDQQLAQEMSFQSFDHNRLEMRVARRRSAARLLRESRLPEDAERELQTALELDPSNLDVRLDLVSLYIGTDRIADSRRMIDEVVAEEPANRRGKLLLGVVLFRENRLDEAEELLQQVLLLNPDPVYTHYYLGLIRQRRGDHEQAAVHFQEALGRLLIDRTM
jgi:tetratricopeptide (TPR) repeat protein